VIVVKECKALPVEFIVRAYLTGTSTTSAWYNYNRGVRNLCGNTLPDGMKKNQKFEKPILTPTTKSKAGDQNISKETILAEGLIDEDLLDQIEEVCFKLFQRGTEVAAQRGLILVDTKYEFGLLDGKLVLIDEVHTPDSSRYWYINTYQELFEKEADQRMLDKEYVREWLVSKGFRGEGVPPPITDEVRTEASKRYLKVYEILTGQLLTPTTSNVVERIKDNLTKGGYI